MDGQDGPARGALYGFLALGGALVGLMGAFQHHRSLLACVFVLACTFLAIRGAGWAAGTRTGAIIPAVTWVVVTGALSTARPEGDVVVTGSLDGLLFLFGGAVVALVAVLLTPARTSFFTGLPQ